MRDRSIKLPRLQHMYTTVNRIHININQLQTHVVVAYISFSLGNAKAYGSYRN